MDPLHQLLTTAKARQPAWNAWKLGQFLAALTTAQRGLWIDWEEGDERWARVLRDGELLGLLSADLPVAFLHHAIASTATDAAPYELPAIHAVESFESPVFSTTHAAMEAAFGRSLITRVDYTRLSISDLWWITVH